MVKHALLLAVLLPSSALAAAASVREARELEIRKLNQEIAATRLDRTLDLSRDEARTLLPVLGEVLQMRDRLKAEREKRNPDDIIKALTAVRDEVVRTGAVTDATRMALLEARREANFKDVREKVRALLVKFRAVLSPEQMARLEEFDPRPIERSAQKNRELSTGEDCRRSANLRKALKVATGADFVRLVEMRAR
jgi:hypothetical protein